MKSNKVSLNIIEKGEIIDGYGSNYLKFKLAGTNINYVIANTLVRTGLSLLGTYSFNPELITIDKNTSIFNNDQMRLRLANMAIINKNYKKPIIKYTTETVNSCLDLEILTNSHLFQIKNDNINDKTDLVNNLTMSIFAKNDTNETLNVTTNSKYTSFYKDGNKIDDIYPREILVIQLKPGEEFLCTAISDFNIPMYNNIYSTVSVFSYEEINDNEYEIYLESNRQISEEDIIKYCCKIIINKLIHIEKIIINKISETNEYEGTLNLENENHTLGNLLTRAIQDHKNISFCGYKIDHPDINELTIKYKTEGNTFINILKEVIKKQIELFETIGELI
jgi:DNA-directed RNA polymerase subunit L